MLQYCTKFYQLTIGCVDNKYYFSLEHFSFCRRSRTILESPPSRPIWVEFMTKFCQERFFLWYIFHFIIDFYIFSDWEKKADEQYGLVEQTTLPEEAAAEG